MNPRSLLIFTHDVVVTVLAWWLAYWLRFNLEIPRFYEETLVQRLPWIALTHGVVFLALGLYRGLWRFASLPDLQRILVAVGISALAIPALLTVLRLGDAVPRSAYLMAPVLIAMIMGGSRLTYRAWKEGRLFSVITNPDALPVIVLGAGAAGAALIKDLAASREWRVIGLLDDDTYKRGGEVLGVKVLGGLDDAGPVAANLGVAQAIIAMPGATHSARRRALKLCVDAGLQVMTVPAYSDIVSGKVSVSALRNVELDDLLGRDPVKLDRVGVHRLLEGKRVLITGAGGSIGSELCRQVMSFGPERLILLDNSEYALYAIEQELIERFPDERVIAVIGDVKDRNRLAQIFEEHRPQTVFHAAAYKHVPLTESGNAWEAVRNNAFGTRQLTDYAVRCAVEKLVFVSTDKAVNPTNVMGASKRLAEMVCQSLQPSGGTQIVLVRFGNVLGSSGSVVPRFSKQIAAGGPVTVTHPEVTRYFMSIPEAVQLVIQAGAMGNGGEIYVLDMGEPVKIVDLARDMIRLSGFTEDDIKIEFTGLRPGEKLYEELLASDESTIATHHPKLRIARSRPVLSDLVQKLDAWFSRERPLSDEEVRVQLRHWIPEYEAQLLSESARPGVPDDQAARRP